MTAIWAGGVLTAYLVITGIILAVGASRLDASALPLHGALLSVVVACTWWKRVPAWLRNWMPVVAIPILYVEAPNVIAAAGHLAMRDPEILRIELALFGGNPAADFARTWPSRILSELLHACYLSYYAIVISMPLLLQYSRRGRDYSRAVFALLLTFTTCFMIYAVYPVEGPRYRGGADAPDGPICAATLWLLENGSSRGTAFPSSHVAVAVAQSIVAIYFFGARGAWLALLTLGLALGAVYGGFHYAIDAVAGAVLGTVTAAFALYVSADRAPTQANATEPT
ncbi:MAG: phosphatase PAP2 family protein [Gemmatimonadota bacterium]